MISITSFDLRILSPTEKLCQNHRNIQSRFVSAIFECGRPSKASDGGHLGFTVLGNLKFGYRFGLFFGTTPHFLIIFQSR